MEQLFTYQILGFFQAEWSTILTILGMGTLYFLVPVVGYESSGRGPLAAAMWAMILKLGMGVFRSCLMVLILMNGRATNSPSRFPFQSGFSQGDLEQNLVILLTLGESVVFMGAMILFVYGLQKLRRRPQAFPG